MNRQTNKIDIAKTYADVDEMIRDVAGDAFADKLAAEAQSRDPSEHLIRAIKAVTADLRQRFDPEKLTKLYHLIERLEIPSHTA